MSNDISVAQLIKYLKVYQHGTFVLKIAEDVYFASNNILQSNLSSLFDTKYNNTLSKKLTQR